MSVPSAIFITGASGYVGNIISGILSKNDVQYSACSSRAGSQFQYTLDSLFAFEIPRNSLIIHCAYDFSLKAEKDNSNLTSLKRLIDYCRSRDSGLLLISSSSADYPTRSKYAQTKHLQEHLVFEFESGSILRLGIILDNKNIFIKLLRVSSRLKVTFCKVDNLPIFRLNTIDQIAFALESFLVGPHSESQQTFCAYDLGGETLAFREIEKIVIGKKALKALPLIPIGAIIFVLKKFSRITRVNRLKHSFCFILKQRNVDII